MSDYLTPVRPADARAMAAARDYIKLYKLLSEGDGTEEPGKAVQEEAAVPPKSPRARKTAPKAVAPVAKSDEKDDDPGMAEE